MILALVSQEQFKGSCGLGYWVGGGKETEDS